MEEAPYLLAVFYNKPHGRKSLIKLVGADTNDIEWFKKNEIQLSAEMIPGESGQDYVVYGLWPEQDEDDECLVISPKGTTAETFKNLRKQLEQLKP